MANTTDALTPKEAEVLGYVLRGLNRLNAVSRFDTGKELISTDTQQELFAFIRGAVEELSPQAAIEYLADRTEVNAADV